MSRISPKLNSWEGKNKARVRLHKLHKVSLLKDEVGGELERQGFIEDSQEFNPRCLTFAGPHARFERLLVDHGITTAKDIMTIQTYEKVSEGHYGKDILKKLVNTRKRFLGGMKIWPYNFLSFSKCYNALGDEVECYYPSNSTTAQWAKPPFSGLMNNVVNNPPGRFSVLDIDLCGIFNKTNAISISNLFNNKALADHGVMFVNHLKGRDVRGGRLYDILLDELEHSEYILFDSIRENFEEHPTYYSRYVLIPLYYMCKAYDSGYVLWLDKLIEYRDKNPETGLAVNMLQYFFGWSKQSMCRRDHGEVRLRSMVDVMSEQYGYQQWID